ncbi:MAG: G5 domain-containing protein [Oscillospiraceae bacterium]|jgi:uncharacterized protein YabE (DUF348 family)/3D (Asp-Asp-Asp) domain-containing protein|nr:G5 domain-containing protein [Oscillospiraceae bacterium]
MKFYNKKFLKNNYKKVTSLTLMSAFFVVGTASVSGYKFIKIIDENVDESKETVCFVKSNKDPEILLQQAGIFVGKKDRVFSDDNLNLIKITRAIPIKVVTSNASIEYNGVPASVEEILSQNNISISDSKPDSYEISYIKKDSNIIVEVKRFFDIEIEEVDFKTKKLRVPEGNIKETLEFANIKLGEFDECSEKLEKKVCDDMKIFINRVEFKKDTCKKEIDFKTIEKESENVKSANEVLQEGCKGEKEIVKEEKFVNGKLVEKTKISSKITKKPIDKIILVPPKNKTKQKHGNVNSNFLINNDSNTVTSSDGRTFKILKTCQGTCTAYTTADSSSYTSTGIVPYRGIVAVNPKEISYGSLVFVEGYGLFVASDTGGSLLRGKVKLDIFMDTTEECNKFGVQHLTYHIVFPDK